MTSTKKNVVQFEPIQDHKEDPWGKANDRRGKRYSELAKEFIRKFPIGSTPTVREFDLWLEENGQLQIPYDGIKKNTDTWLAHLQRRNILKIRINSAATHPRMSEEGSTPFKIVNCHGGYEVRSPQAVLASGELPRKISTLTNTKREQLAHLMQSADWSALPVHERAVAETIYEDIEAFAEDAKTAVDRINRKVGKLQEKLGSMVSSGEIKPLNGGLMQLLRGDPTVIDGTVEE